MKTTSHTLTAFALLAFSSMACAQAGVPSDKGASSHNTMVTIEPVVDSGTISYANAWRITLDKQAESDGQIVFRMIRKDKPVDSTRISITFTKGTTKSDVAKVIEEALASNAPTGIKVERNANDEVSISATAGVSVTVDSTIADLGIALVQE